MYAPVGRRDFLRTDLTIEEDFQGVAANHELLVDISASFTSSENETQLLKSELDGDRKRSEIKESHAIHGLNTTKSIAQLKLAGALTGSDDPKRLT